MHAATGAFAADVFAMIFAVYVVRLLFG